MRLRILSSLLLGAVLSAQTATFTPFGTGCYLQRQSFYQLFNQNTFDMAGTTSNPGGFTMINLGQGFIVLPLLGQWHVPTAAAGVVGLSDDSVSGAQPLGFSMPYPGGSTSSVWIASNGFILLQAGTGSDCCSGSSNLLLNGLPRVSPFWMDLNPNLSTGITFEADSANQVAYVTFQSIPEFSGGGSVTFQVAFYSYGQIDVLFGPCTSGGHTSLTGWSRGGGSLDPGGIDISTSIPFVSGQDMNALSLSSTGRPRIGTVMPLTTTNLPVVAPIILLLSGTQFLTGLDLASIGMGGCKEYVGLDGYFVVPASGSVATMQLTIPNSSGLVGQRVYAQSIALAPQLNIAGLTTSNGATLLIGSL